MDYPTSTKQSLYKLPPPASTDRKCSRQTMQRNDPFLNQVKAARVLINRSISSSLASFSQLESPFQLHSNSSFDRLSSLCNSSPQKQASGKQLLSDHNSNSSGYDSNGSSSRLCQSPFNSTHHQGVIRRVPSVHYIYPNQSGSNNSSTTLSSNNRFKRYSYNEPNNNNIKNDIINSLDKIDKRVAFFSEVAIELCEEKEKLLDSLKQIDSISTANTISEVDLNDIQTTVDSLLQRLASVQITINSVRTPKQMDAFNQTIEYIENLHNILNKEGKMAAKQRCLSYISSCSSDNQTDSNNNQILVPIDERFQKMIIACTLADQKLLKKKLTTTLANIENTKAQYSF